MWGGKGLERVGESWGSREKEQKRKRRREEKRVRREEMREGKMGEGGEEREREGMRRGQEEERIGRKEVPPIHSAPHLYMEEIKISAEWERSLTFVRLYRGPTLSFQHAEGS